MEGVWKRDIWLGCKALDPKAENGDRNLDVQLGKMDVKRGKRTYGISGLHDGTEFAHFRRISIHYLFIGSIRNRNQRSPRIYIKVEFDRFDTATEPLGPI